MPFNLVPVPYRFTLYNVPDGTRNIQNLLREDGLANCKIQHVGGLSIVCECSSREAAKACLLSNKEMLSSWLVDFKLWEPHAIPQERLVWLDISGLPIEAWSTITLRQIGDRFGKVLEVDDILFEGNMASSFGVLILSSCFDDICSSFLVKVDGLLYKIKVVEERNRAFFFSSNHSFASEKSSENDVNFNLDDLDAENLDEVESDFSDEDGIPETEPLGEGLEQTNGQPTSVLPNFPPVAEAGKAPSRFFPEVGPSVHDRSGPGDAPLENLDNLKKHPSGLGFFGDCSSIPSSSNSSVPPSSDTNCNHHCLGSAIGVTYAETGRELPLPR
ncbi:hypothetical protein OSB04_008145 [Centaurea solstitialis]|uniref:DUF4283 domain-containing protein n=1 Tax=Centaurea solstitialis TaxID=347529 RepID=A0AA38WR90_9ASTR|nr:hypothetical protein OSB04_008145 [Centaurea solstitialis]